MRGQPIHTKRPVGQHSRSQTEKRVLRRSSRSLTHCRHLGTQSRSQRLWLCSGRTSTWPSLARGSSGGRRKQWLALWTLVRWPRPRWKIMACNWGTRFQRSPLKQAWRSKAKACLCRKEWSWCGWGVIRDQTSFLSLRRQSLKRLRQVSLYVSIKD